MDYKTIKKNISSENQNLLKFINKDEIKWLDKHFAFINGLLMGRVKPSEKKYENFIDVIKNRKEPTTEPEKIYSKFIKYFDEQIKKSRVKTKDPNILFDGIEIYPTGMRPVKGHDVDIQDDRGRLGDNESERDWGW